MNKSSAAKSRGKFDYYLIIKLQLTSVINFKALGSPGIRRLPSVGQTSLTELLSLSNLQDAKATREATRRLPASDHKPTG